MPRARARSRFTSIDMRIDSVPPEVIVPPPPSGACSSAPVIATTSRSSAASSANLNGLSALPKRYRRFTSAISVSRSGRPVGYTRPNSRAPCTEGSRPWRRSSSARTSSAGSPCSLTVPPRDTRSGQCYRRGRDRSRPAQCAVKLQQFGPVVVSQRASVLCPPDRAPPRQRLPCRPRPAQGVQRPGTGNETLASMNRSCAKTLTDTSDTCSGPSRLRVDQFAKAMCAHRFGRRLALPLAALPQHSADQIAESRH